MKMSELDPLVGYTEVTTARYQRVKNASRNCRFSVLGSVLFVGSLTMALCVIFMMVVDDYTDDPIRNPDPNNSLLQMSFPISSKHSKLRDAPPSFAPSKTNVDPDVLKECAMRAQEGLAYRKKLEKDLYDVYETTRKNQPTYYHQQITPLTEEAEKLSDSAALMESTFKCLMEQNVPLEMLEKGDLEILQKEWPYCQSRQMQCSSSRFRSVDGTCNNMKNPHFGAALQPFRRLLPPAYEDGFASPRNLSVHETGSWLPPGRQVSLCFMNKTEQYMEPRLSSMFLNFAQFIGHDISSTVASRGRNGSGIPCCPWSAEQHPECYPMWLKFNDPFFKDKNMDCMDFVRSAPAPQCNGGVREQMNQASAFIDGSPIYSSSLQDNNNRLRDHDGGYLRTPTEKDGRYMLPRSKEANDGCNRKDMLDQERFCFKSGDSRVNLHIGLTMMHTVWMREHNRISDYFIKLNKNWDDDRLYEEARRITIAQLQHITYNEFLPLLLGNKLTEALQLKPLKEGYYEGYDDGINAAVSNEFATAAFRFGHSMVQGLVNFHSAESVTELIMLSKMTFHPFPLWDFGRIDAVIRGSASQNPRPVHPTFATQLSNNLFQTEASNYGYDLFALNIHRGRDHGLQPYYKWREICNLSPINKYSELTGVFKQKPLEVLTRFYKDYRDIDLYTGILAEIPLEDAIVGPVGSCILADQFVRLKKADRYWYETADPSIRFTPEQLAAIRKVTFARVLCDNGDAMNVIQERAMESVGDQNPRKQCSEDDMGRLNLDLWKDIQ